MRSVRLFVLSFVVGAVLGGALAGWVWWPVRFLGLVVLGAAWGYLDVRTGRQA